ncbi:MAG: metalloregulator ArsR/SmtB family transcription factor [Sphingopyxis sp.]|nr:metalloregulator ArsR/SmtB family transcription factor [Sphingopyxis sp.]
MSSLLSLFHGLADPTRVRIVALLRTMELAIGELAVVLQQSQPRVSRHVRILADAGLVVRRREGGWVFLRLRPSAPMDQLLALFDAWSATAEEEAVFAADRARLETVREERAAAAHRYFAEHAQEWDAIRARHVAEGEVESAMLHLMHNRRVGHLLDIGTGTGRMAEIFAATTRQITALDRSPEMLRIARAKLADRGIAAELVQGDFTALPMAARSVDTVVMHQVLHFAHEPDRVIAEVARVLGPGGHLLIVDFAPHDQEDLRTQAAHARLGFSDAQMRGWFASTGLLLETSQALAGNPLTVKLWLARRRSEEGQDEGTANAPGKEKRIAA